jgi:hypothetical protein
MPSRSQTPPVSHTVTRCYICMNLEAVDVLELDHLMGDPACWPRTFWKDAGWQPPKGLLPPKYRLWGALAIGQDFLKRKGYTVQDKDLRRHYYNHVAKVVATPKELAETGVIAGKPVQVPFEAPIDPTLFMRYYASAVEVGVLGLTLLKERVERLIAAEQQVPMDLLKMMVDTGSKMAQSQASIKARGVDLGRSDDLDAFRTAASDDPSPRFGRHRIRLIEGERRPVVDAGPADRAEFNEKAAASGGTKLPQT